MFWFVGLTYCALFSADPIHTGRSVARSASGASRRARRPKSTSGRTPASGRLGAPLSFVPCADCGCLTSWPPPPAGSCSSSGRHGVADQAARVSATSPGCPRPESTNVLCLRVLTIRHPCQNTPSPTGARTATRGSATSRTPRSTNVRTATQSFTGAWSATGASAIRALQSGMSRPNTHRSYRRLRSHGGTHPPR